MNIWVTSDTHFGHEKILTFMKRPWNTVQEMNEGLISAYNEVVGPKDEVWHLGDFSFRNDPSVYLSKLNGRVNLILGNHDRKNKALKAGFKSVREVHYLRYNGMRFWLSHYAHVVWPSSHKGSFHLFGHSHGDRIGLGKSMDVGVDVSALLNSGSYRPFNIDEVLALLEHRPISNHHEPRDAKSILSDSN